MVHSREDIQERTFKKGHSRKDIQEKLATLGTQDTGRRQNKTTKDQRETTHTTPKAKNMSHTVPTINRR